MGSCYLFLLQFGELVWSEFVIAFILNKISDGVFRAQMENAQRVIATRWAVYTYWFVVVSSPFAVIPSLRLQGQYREP